MLPGHTAPADRNYLRSLAQAVSRVVWRPAGVAIIALAAAAGAAAGAQMLEPAQWHWDDWGAVAIAMTLGALFFALSQLAQRRHSELVKALADSALADKVGAIGINSMKTRAGGVTGADYWSLSIAKDALGVMPLFRAAGAAEQERFLGAVVDAYSALTLNTFIRRSDLPMAVNQRLDEDGRSLAERLNAEVGQDTTVTTLARITSTHISECLAQSFSEPSVLHPTFDFVRQVFEPELRVHRSWESVGLRELRVEVSQVGLSWLADSYAPWYVSQYDGLHQEVNYNGQVLAPGPIDVAADLPMWPRPVSHRSVTRSRGLRAEGINRMRRHMEDAGWPAFALLVYELAGGSRIILDGNHRVAALLRARPRPTPKIVAFVLAETEEFVAKMSVPRFRGDLLANENELFNPDVAHIRRAMPSEKYEFDVTLEEAGDKKVQVIKELRALTGLGLTEATEVVQGAPRLLLDKVNKQTAYRAKAALEKAGATITVT